MKCICNSLKCGLVSNVTEIPQKICTSFFALNVARAQYFKEATARS